MTLSILIGRIVSVYFLACGIGFLLSTDFYKRLANNSQQSDPLAVNLTGMVHLLIGMTILVNHFLWTSTFAIAITLIGFAFLGKGVAFIVLPDVILKAGTISSRVLRIAGFGFILVGLYLGYMSYLSQTP